MDIQIPTVTKIVEWEPEDSWFAWFAVGPFEFFEVLSSDLKLKEELKTLWMTGVFHELSQAYAALKSLRAYEQGKTALAAYQRDCNAVVNHCWVAYKEFMQKIVKALGYDIGFIYQKSDNFLRNGEAYTNANEELKPFFEWVKAVREEAVNDVNTFRREIEHPTRARANEDEQYVQENIENIFKNMCFVVEGILMFFIGLKLPTGMVIVQTDNPDNKDGYPRKYRIGILSEAIKPNDSEAQS